MGAPGAPGRATGQLRLAEPPQPAPCADSPPLERDRSGLVLFGNVKVSGAVMDDFEELASRFGAPAWDLDGAGLVATPAVLATALRDGLRQAGLVDVVVTGVAGGIRRRRRLTSFELSETLPGDTTPVAVIAVVAFGASLAPARRVTAGAQVRVHGHLDWKPEWGQLRLICDDVEVVAQTSEVAQARDRLVRDLIGEGLWQAQDRLAVPNRPRRIGLICGQGSAAEADVRASLPGWAGIELVVGHAPMSGERAADTVAGQIRAMATHTPRPDLIVIARGGGARSELDWADVGPVVRAIATSPIPVWTALGHATDSTIADHVAHRSCVTPTAAATAIVEVLRDHHHDRELAGPQPTAGQPHHGRFDLAPVDALALVLVVAAVLVALALLV